MVFGLIITTNLIDKNNFIQVRDSVVTIYEDRLIANDLIFEMLKSVQAKELAVSKSDSVFFSSKNTAINHKLESLIDRFEKTKLTTQETKEFGDLKNNIKLLIEAEAKFLTSNTKDVTVLNNHITNLKSNLDDLSKIQLNEGSRQMTISKKAINTVELFTQLEIYLLVFLAIIIQVIVMYNPKEKS